MIVFSIYELFFIDAENNLWALLKDGRVSFIKKTHSFSGISGDHNLLTNVIFDGKYTHLMATPLNFNEKESNIIHKVYGYCYYPICFEPKNIAFIKADLFNQEGLGSLMVYHKTNASLKKLAELNATIAPILWNSFKKELFFIDANKNLSASNLKEVKEIFPNVKLFTINSLGTEIAFVCESEIHILSLNTGSMHKFIAFDISALTFSLDSACIYFATHKGGVYNIYKYIRKTQEVEWVQSHSTPIMLLTWG